MSFHMPLARSPRRRTVGNVASIAGAVQVVRDDISSHIASCHCLDRLRSCCNDSILNVTSVQSEQVINE